MEILEKIFVLLNLTPEQKDQAYKDFDVLVKAKVTEQLLSELPEEKRLGINADNAGDILKNFYPTETIEENTRNSIKIVIKEYIDFLLQKSTDQEKQEMAKIIQEASSQK